MFLITSSAPGDGITNTTTRPEEHQPLAAALPWWFALVLVAGIIAFFISICLLVCLCRKCHCLPPSDPMDTVERSRDIDDLHDFIANHLPHLEDSGSLDRHRAQWVTATSTRDWY